MESLSADAVARLLEEIGQRMELGGESPFKVRAYYAAAENLRALEKPLADIVSKGALRDIPGIGEAIAEKVIKLHKTGTHPTLEHLREQIPAGVLQILELPGLGPKKVLTLYNDLKISSIDELEAACNEDKLSAVKGIGPSLQAKILKGIEFKRKGQGKMLLDAAEIRMREAMEAIRSQCKDLSSFSVAGSLRRGCEIVDNISVVAVGVTPDGKEEVRTVNGVPVIVTSSDRYGLTLVEQTGSVGHITALRARAEEMKLNWTAQGLMKGKAVLPTCAEADVYETLNLPFIAPELRESGDEVALAAREALPSLVDDTDIQGILHSHTDFSDGAETLESMAREVQRRGYHYYGVSDHSQTAAYAGGLKEDKVRAQWELADTLNLKLAKENFRIFKGIESDILDEGALDYPDEVLREFDFIVASVHSRFTLDKEAQTRRIIRAVENPHTTILGHVTGRLLLHRTGYDVDVEAILKACAKHGVVVEINANPYRLDLDWRWHHTALDLGVMLSINPDAHSVADLSFTRLGVMQARKGGVGKEKILNCLSLKDLSQYFENRRKRALKG